MNSDNDGSSRREQVFFDKSYIEADRYHATQGYIVSQAVIRQFTHPERNPLDFIGYAASLVGNVNGKRVLDYGAGDGWCTVALAKAGARVWAIEISAIGIELIKKKSVANNVAESVTAEAGDCHETRFEAGFFDIVWGQGILHHMDIDRAGKEVSRILHPDGRAIFAEPLRETPIVNAMSSVVKFLLGVKSEATTEDEQPLRTGEIRRLRAHFKIVNCHYFLVVSALNKVIKSKKIHKILYRVDHFLIRYIPGFRKLCRGVVIEVKEPIKL